MFFYVALAIGLLVDRRKAVFVGAAAVLAAILIAMTAKATFAPDNVFATFYSRAISIDFFSASPATISAARSRRRPPAMCAGLRSSSASPARCC